MTQRYIACLFEPGRPKTLAPRLLEALREQQVLRRLDDGDWQLFAGDDLPLRVLPQDAGIALGILFERSGADAPAELDMDLAGDGADRMVQRFWGSYVVLGPSQDGRFRILRDPSGALSCYHAHLDGIHYFTSMPHLLVDCGLLAGDVDWAVIARSLTQHAARSAETALRGIDEVLPGTLLTCGPEGEERRHVWEAWRHAGNSLAEDPAETLKQALGLTLGAWGRLFQRPLIEISGGLDSAIVAAGLAPAARSPSLITFAAAPGDPDETAYARAIADHLGLPLEIVMPRIEDIDLGRSLSRNLPRPNARAFTQAADAQSLQHGRAIGADAFVSGGGGDDVFCYLRTILPAVDRLQAEGWQAMTATALDIATMTHATFWEALVRIVRRRIRGRSTRPSLDLRFVSAELAGGLAAAESVARAASTLPGKADHLRGILTIHNYLEGHARADFAPILSPLLSQPIVECCLSIPTWSWCEGGRNRAVARRAFAGRLPQIVLERRSKGSFDGFCARLLQENSSLVRDMLLDGRLAAQGLLDRQAIANAMQNPFPPADAVARLLTLVDVESWVQSWISRPGHCL